ncbi:MAG: 4-(cytidine 5'-diphospho)-2-C-methyl-D-erythritol kinase [Gammaproteobacteria bacterium CG22_combo_CG10-13_8_21_14_all_40_8]|nr:MAG: 4-(cytidine 5'-diphospho)-2-C-methyl-D-erythritol kinase [Gammaproteobacteria bacterium CG22_combo_CG10-13_8_21_14_all_40_8]
MISHPLDLDHPLWQRWWPAPAKINRFLHIVGRRENGYHELQSVFQYLEFADELQFTPTAAPKIKLTTQLEGVRNDDNLIVKAASLLQPYRSAKQAKAGLNIQLKKNLPMGAGLGGGSSDAATTLLFLNKAWGLGFSLQQLATIALPLGADIPFFILGQNAFVEGIGEKITPISLDNHWLLLLIPPCQISTPKIFSHQLLTRNTEIIKIRDLATMDSKICLNHFGRNDCEAVVCQEYAEVAEAKNWLNQYQIARLTGTGACVFAMFDNEREVRTIATRCPAKFKPLVTRSMNSSTIHPLLDD